MTGANALNHRTADLPDGYRLTELGPLPKEWQVVRLGEIFEIQQGKALSQKARSGNRKRPFLRTSNILWGRIDLTVLDEMHFEPKEEQSLALRSGDLLVCEGGDIGRTAMWEGQLPLCLYQNHLHRLRTIRDHSVEPAFYMYWMQAAWTLLGLYGGSANRTTIPNLSRSRLACFPVPYPPLFEQRAIAHVLRTVQRAKEATERVIAALKELKKSLMRHLFTYGPVPVDAANHAEMQETDIGPIPAHWRVVRLGQVVILRNGTVSPSDNPQAPYVGFEHLDSGEIRIKRHGYAFETKSAKSVFNPGDIMYGKLRPYLDKSALAEWSGVCSTDILVLIPAKQVDPVFTAYLMHSSFVLQHAIATTSGVNHPRTSWRALSQALVPLPPLPEQREIAHILQSVDRKIEAEEARRQALEALFKTLLHQLMTGNLRVAGLLSENSEGSS